MLFNYLLKYLYYYTNGNDNSIICYSCTRITSRNKKNLVYLSSISILIWLKQIIKYLY